ncbi:MAG: FHA domain-containing protein, partial [Sandaracinaceae bacterium]
MSEPTKTTLPYPGEAVIVPVSALRAEVTEGPLAGRAAETEHDTLQIGSAEDNDLVIADDPTVSRYHVELSREDDGILVQDHGSTNGTFFGEVRIERAVVPPGASLRLGRTGVRVRDGQRRSVELP